MNTGMFSNISSKELEDINGGFSIDDVLRIGGGATVFGGGCSTIYAGVTATTSSMLVAGVSVSTGLVVFGGVVAVVAGGALVAYGIYSLLK